MKESMESGLSTHAQDKQPGDIDQKCLALPSKDATCWLCLGEGPGDDGEPLRRDCSCRGESGFAHLSCLVRYAEHQSQHWDGRKILDFSRPWKVCGNCHQNYQNELAVDLAARFVAFTEEEYPGDQARLLRSLNTKLWALVGLHVNGKQQHKEEAGQLANTILSKVDYMKKTNSSLPQTILILEANTYNRLGVLHCEGTKEDAKKAMEYFEKFRDIYKRIGSSDGVITAEHNIARAKKQYGGSNASGGELLQKMQEIYEQRVATGDDGSTLTIDAGLALAYYLRCANRRIEAERLLTKLVFASKRVHGSDHSLTKKSSSQLKRCKMQFVWVKSQSKSKRFQALRYEENGDKCVVLGPVTNPRNIPAERIFHVATKDIRLTLGTPVVCQGLKTSTHLNGKIGDLRSREEIGSFNVHFEEEDLEPHRLTEKFMRILFDLPDK